MKVDLPLGAGLAAAGGLGFPVAAWLASAGLGTPEALETLMRTLGIPGVAIGLALWIAAHFGSLRVQEAQRYSEDLKALAAEHAAAIERIYVSLEKTRAEVAADRKVETDWMRSIIDERLGRGK